jgi:Mrp family chromosome partitioning ATPase
MTTLGLIAELPTATEPQRMPVREAAVTSPAAFRGHGVHDEQIQALVQQLFLQQNPALVRHVGFAAVDSETETAQLCLDVALTLADSGSHDVGLVDARLQSEPLHTQLQIPAGSRPDASWPISDRLWLAPRRSWLDDSPQRIWDPSLARLRAVTMEFDFSIVCLDPVSWFTAKLNQSCHGLVMVLRASQTRRLVAAQMQENLRRARVPLLGTVLTGRRFPIPTGLYRNL